MKFTYLVLTGLLIPCILHTMDKKEKKEEFVPLVIQIKSLDDGILYDGRKALLRPLVKRATSLCFGKTRFFVLRTNGAFKQRGTVETMTVEQIEGIISKAKNVVYIPDIEEKKFQNEATKIHLGALLAYNKLIHEENIAVMLKAHIANKSPKNSPKLHTRTSSLVSSPTESTVQTSSEPSDTSPIEGLVEPSTTAKKYRRVKSITPLEEKRKKTTPPADPNRPRRGKHAITQTDKNIDPQSSVTQ